MDIISPLPHLAPILTDIIAKLPDNVSRVNGFALFQILNNFPVEFSPRGAGGRGRARDAKGILVSAAVLGTLSSAASREADRELEVRKLQPLANLELLGVYTTV